MASDKIFSDEYLDQLNPQQQKEQEPVTIFGLTFKNDEERRQYFRDELRRRLPELRKIEGFPVGEDDDIINLSDPPYYTACPNPWLNDFIKEWEEEKKQLQLGGKRKADFEVKEPYASELKHVEIAERYMQLKLQMNGKECLIQRQNGELDMQSVVIFLLMLQICHSVITALLIQSYCRMKWSE